MKKTLIFIFVAAIIFILLNKDSAQTWIYSPKVEPKIDSTITITISAVGDLMCHSTQYKYARISRDSFNFAPVFKEVKHIFDSSNFVIGNLETVIAGKNKRYSGYPMFNTPEDFVTGLKTAGFDLLVTANNHSYDQDSIGVVNTLKAIKKNELKFSGTFLNKADKDSITIYDVQGIKLSVLAYTYGVNGNGPSNEHRYSVNFIDTTQIKKDIKLARKSGAEIVIMFYHFGKEYEHKPNRYQKNVVGKTIEFGADIILGCHPHVIQEAGYFVSDSSNLETGYYIYSMGNFISNQRWRYSDAGVIVNLDITKNIFTDSLYLSKVEHIPTWVYKGNTEQGKEYIIFPAKVGFDSTKIPKFFTSDDSLLIKESYFDTKKVLGMGDSL